MSSTVSKISTMLLFLLCTSALSVRAVQLRPVGRGKLAVYVGTGDCDPKSSDDLSKKARSALKSVSSLSANHRPDSVSVLWTGDNTCLFVGSARGSGNAHPHVKKVLELVAADPSETLATVVTTDDTKNTHASRAEAVKSALRRRSILDKRGKKKVPSMKDYLDEIDHTAVTSGLWSPAKQWNRLHGDGKSGTGGVYHIETMHGSDGRYIAKVVGGAGLTVDWPAGSEAPTAHQVIAKLKEHA